MGEIEDEQAVCVVVIAYKSHAWSSRPAVRIHACVVRADIHIRRIRLNIPHLLSNRLIDILHMAICRIVTLQ